jgi:1-acyl-sn-glycerol-3-phosphate acyltransferase
MIHRVVRGIARFLFFLFVKLDVQGIEHVPEEGPALLVCNHVNLMDPVVPLGVFKRPVSFMAKEELFSVPIFGRLLRAIKIVPVARGSIASRRALKRAEELLLDDWLFSIYPEGTRSRRPGMGPAHHGAALLALRTGVPIVPTALIGTHRIAREDKFFPRRGPVSYRIGPSFQVERQSGKIGRPLLEELTDRMMRRVATLLPPEYQGVYASDAAVAGVSQ